MSYRVYAIQGVRGVSYMGGLWITVYDRVFQTDFYKVYIGYESGVIQCILRNILKGILLVKYKVLHPGFRQISCSWELSTVSMRLIYGSCRNKVLFSYLYLSWYYVIWDDISLLSCCVLPSEPIPLHVKTYLDIRAQNIHASLRSFATREEVVRECMSCGKGRKCRI